MSREEKKPDSRPECPICGQRMNKPFGHFYFGHSKWEIAKLVIKLLKLEGVRDV